MKRFLATVLILLLLLPLAAAETDSTTVTYEPYQSGEFPQWAYELRRGETLFFGSLAITFPMVVLGWNGINLMGGDLPTSPAFETTLKQAGVACILSFGIALADWIIGEVQENRQNAKQNY
ncbi:MAG: hypothetical protein SPF89_01785 [Sphaerochaetaceae bacterium]|nr:hypothetical protein [Spirochaetales bacterium]MDY5498816.1 hypothetical protein [Sphaerochaetaceae bacterium]